MEKETVRFPAKGKQEDQQPTVDPKKESDYSGAREYGLAAQDYEKKHRVKPWNPPKRGYTEEEIAEALRGDKDVKFDLAHPVLPTDRVVNPTAFDKLLDEVEWILSARDEKDIKDLIKDGALHRINLETIFSEYYSGRRKDPGGLKKKTAKIINNLN